MMETLVKKLLKYIAYPAALFANQISGSGHYLLCDFLRSGFQKAKEIC